MALSGHADLLRRAVREQPADWIVAHAEDVRGHVAAIEAALRDRQAILSL